VNGAAAEPGQLALALRFPPDQRLDTFVTGDAALPATLQALAQPDGAVRHVYVAGSAGSGKTHLALAACAEASERGVEAAYVPLHAAAGRVRDALQGMDRHRLVALDGLDATAGDRDAEVALFDFHNRVQDAGGALLYTASQWPDALDLCLPDLRSRLAQCTRIALAPLDDAGRAQMLRLRAARRGLQFDEAAIDWLLRRVGRDPAGLAQVFDRLDRAALAQQRGLTVPFLRKVLGA
jgi:DnaA family protein